MGPTISAKDVYLLSFYFFPLYFRTSLYLQKMFKDSTRSSQFPLLTSDYDAFKAVN